MKERLGLILGRFQPLHPGHLYLFSLAFRENNKIIICIGSAQSSEPFSIKERHQRIQKQLEILGYDRERYRIVDLVDPKPMDIWPSYVKEICGITNETKNFFYRSDKLPKRYEQELARLGFRIRYVKRKPFYYRGPDGFYYQISSASEIKEIHRKLGKEIG